MPPTTPFFPAKRPVHHKRHEVRRAAPAVIDVQVIQGPWANWTFSRDVGDPAEGVAQFLIDGHGGLEFYRGGSRRFLCVRYPVSVLAGAAWSNIAGAGGVKSADGQALVAGQGKVR